MQDIVRDTARRIEDERKRMQEAHEMAREKDRADLLKAREQWKREKNEEVEKEVKRMKEVLG